MKIVLEDSDIQTMIRAQITQTNLLGLGSADFGIDIIYDDSTDEVTATIDTSVSIPSTTAPVEKKVKRKRRSPAEIAADEAKAAEPVKEEAVPVAEEPDTTGDAPFVPDADEEAEEKPASKSLFA